MQIKSQQRLQKLYKRNHAVLFPLLSVAPQAFQKISQLVYRDLVYILNLGSIPAFYDIKFFKYFEAEWLIPNQINI